MPYGTKAPYRRRYYRRSSKPKARTRVDKAQNTRIKKLEQKEVKFITKHDENISNVNTTSTNLSVTPPVVPGQTYLIPPIYSSPAKYGRIGEEINVRSIELTIRLTAGTPDNQRFILLWDHRPTYQGSDGGNPPKLDRLNNLLSWDSILEHTTNGATTAVNLISPINVANHKARRFSIVMDKTVKKRQNGGEPLQFTMKKNYKGLKLKYEDGVGQPLQSIYPINKQLILCYLSNENPGGNAPQFDYSFMLRWTDL